MKITLTRGLSMKPEATPAIESAYIKFDKAHFICRKASISSCLHIPATDANPAPVTIVFWDHYSQEIPDPDMSVYLYIELVLLKPDTAPEAI